MKTLSLNGQWDGRCISPDGKENFTFLGTVPGCVHTDLMGSHIPKDIYYRDNVEDCQWIEFCDWEYSKVFQLDSLPTKAQLVFEGLDTYADITLNGVYLSSVNNMFIAYRFDVSKFLRIGENNICVSFRSPVREVQGKEVRPGAFTRERMHTRRIQCTYGWDWVARFVTCGIWRDVYLDWGHSFSANHVYVYTENLWRDMAQIVVQADLENYEAGAVLALKVKDPEGNTVFHHNYFCKEPMIREYINIPDARLWYPLGYGEQPIYTLEIGNKRQTFGIRTVMIEERPDIVGSDYHQKCLEIKDSASGAVYDKNSEFSGFRLIVNGIPIMCKGANWVPSEPFPSAETDQKITALLSLAKEAGVNMLRVWGGGIFEKQHFYEECDRLGILVTQDFLMACGHYPEEKEEFIEQLRKETEFAAYALRNHPCLVWWSGDNENAVMGYDDAEDYQGRGAIHKGIMPVLAKLDPKRRFLLSSPYGGKLYASKTVGTTHNTQYMGEEIFPYILHSDMRDYKAHFSGLLARFVAEEPTLGAVSLPSLKRFMEHEDIFDSNEMWDYHMKGNPALPFTLFEILKKFAEKVLGGFADGGDRYFKLKYIQFEWVRITMENARRNCGFLNGLIYWMWNDCWPASAGWAFVDYYCLPKASFYAFKRCAGELLVSIYKSNFYDVYLCNDGIREKDVVLSFFYIKNGKMVSVSKQAAFIGGETSQIACRIPLSALPEDATLICDASYAGGKDRAFYREGKLHMIRCDTPEITARADNSITLSAKDYIHAVELEGEYVFGDNYFSMFPGECRRISFHPSENAQSSELTVAAYTVGM